MNNKHPFDIIDEFCQHQHESFIVRDIAYAIYEDKLQTVINDKIKAGYAPSESEINTMRETLLHEKNIYVHVQIAKDRLDEEKKVNSRTLGIKEFLHAVLASIVANFLFTVIIIVVFMVAQNKIGTWIKLIIEQMQQSPPTP